MFTKNRCYVANNQYYRKEHLLLKYKLHTDFELGQHDPCSNFYNYLRVKVNKYGRTKSQNAKQIRNKRATK